MDKTRRHFPVWQATTASMARFVRSLAPTRGNALFTLLIVGSLILAERAGALPMVMPARMATSTSAIPYQGRLTSASGAPLSGTYDVTFRLYDVASGGTPLWTEQWAGACAVQVTDGLFSVLLGSLVSIPQSILTGHSSLWLGISIGADAEMAPRVQLGTVPYAIQALTVPDGSITEAKLAPDVPRGIAVGAAHASTENANTVSSIQWTEVYSVTYTPTRDDATILMFASVSMWMITAQVGQQCYMSPAYDGFVGGPWTTTGLNQPVGFSCSWQVDGLSATPHTFSIRIKATSSEYPVGWRAPSITVLELYQ